MDFIRRRFSVRLPMCVLSYFQRFYRARAVCTDPWPTCCWHLSTILQLNSFQFKVHQIIWTVQSVDSIQFKVHQINQLTTFEFKVHQIIRPLYQAMHSNSLSWNKDRLMSTHAFHASPEAQPESIVGNNSDPTYCAPGFQAFSILALRPPFSSH